MQNLQTNWKICRLCSHSTFLIARVAMGRGGTQLFKVVHLTGGDMHFRRQSSKSRVFFGAAFGNVSKIGCTGIYLESWEFPGEIMWDNWSQLLQRESFEVLKSCKFQNRGERILSFGPKTNTNNIRNQNFDRIRIRILFVLHYEIKSLHWSWIFSTKECHFYIIFLYWSSCWPERHRKCLETLLLSNKYRFFCRVTFTFHKMALAKSPSSVQLYQLIEAFSTLW